MTSSRSAGTILHHGALRSDSDSRCTRHFGNGKTSPARPPGVPTPDSSRVYLVSGHVRMSSTYGNRKPRVNGWHRKWLCLGPTPSALAPLYYVERILRDATPYANKLIIRFSYYVGRMVKPMLGLAGRVLFKANCQEGPINPHRVRDAKSRNITPV